MDGGRLGTIFRAIPPSISRVGMASDWRNGGGGTEVLDPGVQFLGNLKVAAEASKRCGSDPQPRASPTLVRLLERGVMYLTLG